MDGGGGGGEHAVSKSSGHRSQQQQKPLKKEIKREYRKACLDDDDVFEVEKIVGLTKVDGKTLYRVRWTGYTAQCDTWEPYDNLLTCKDLVDEYIEREQRKKRKAANNGYAGGGRLLKKKLLPQSLERERCPDDDRKGNDYAASIVESSSYRSSFEATAKLIETERQKLHAEQQQLMLNGGGDVRLMSTGAVDAVQVATKARARCTLGGRGGGRMGGTGRTGKARGRNLRANTESSKDGRSQIAAFPNSAPVQRALPGPKSYSEQRNDKELIGEPRVARSTQAASVSNQRLRQSGDLPNLHCVTSSPLLGSVQNQSAAVGDMESDGSAVVSTTAVTPPPRLGSANRPATAVDSAYETGLGSDSSNDGCVGVPRTSPPVVIAGPQIVNPKLPFGGLSAVHPKALSAQFVCGQSLENTAAKSKEVTNDELKHAVKIGDYKTVLLALKDGAAKHDVAQINARGTTLLMMACMAGHDGVAELLLLNGADPNGRHVSGSTPLILASDGGRFDTVNVLLSRGARMELCDENGETALVKACRRGHENIVQLLLTKGANFAKLPRESIDMSTEVLQCLNDHIAKVTCRFDAEVGVTLKRTAKIVQSIFPLQCLSLSEATSFDVHFDHGSSDAVKEAGVGMLLFIAHAVFSNDGICCRLFGQCAVHGVTLNGIKQPPLTENGNFIFSFSPVTIGFNHLNIQATPSMSEVKLLVRAYKARLLTSNELC